MAVVCVGCMLTRQTYNNLENLTRFTASAKRNIPEASDWGKQQDNFNRFPVVCLQENRLGQKFLAMHITMAPHSEWRTLRRAIIDTWRERPHPQRLPWIWDVSHMNDRTKHMPTSSKSCRTWHVNTFVPVPNYLKVDKDRHQIPRGSGSGVSSRHSHSLLSASTLRQFAGRYLPWWRRYSLPSCMFQDKLGHSFFVYMCI